MKTIVYLTKNLVNSRIYIGIHDCEDPEVWDYYLGCGAYANKPSSYNKCKWPLHAAILKYGPKNFRRITLKVFDTREEALYLEGLLVDENFIKRKDTYNVTLGGGNPPDPSKTVYQFDLDGNFIAEFHSLDRASKETGSYLEGIRNAIKYKRSCNNYYWSFTKDPLNLSEYNKTVYKTGVTVYNNELIQIGEFESVSEAARFFDFDPKTISGAMFSKHNCHGLIFIPSNMTLDELLQIRNGFIKTATTHIYCYDQVTGEYIKEYNSLREAANDVNLKTTSPISRSLKTGSNSGGYKWSYYKVSNLLKQKVSTESPKPKKIGQYDLNGELIKVWNIKECREQYPNVIRVCRGAREMAYGYKWKYIV